MRALLRPLLKFCAYLLLFCVVLPLLQLISVFKKIKIGHLMPERIGQLALNTEMLLRRQKLVGDRAVYVFITAGPVSNQQLLTMLKRATHVIDSPFWSRIYQYTVPYFQKTGFYADLSSDDNEHFEMNQHPPLMSFSEEEERYGQEQLRKMGIGAKDWFICFHSRDPAYLTNFMNKGKDFYNYHNHRDSKIESYLPAAQYIAELGGFAIRMGSVVDAPLAVQHPRIIDYATKMRSDFMDIYLSAKCKFFLGNTSGIFLIATVFDRPSACAHYVPFPRVPFLYKDLFIPKLLKDKSTGQILKLSEAKARGLLLPYADKSEYDQLGAEFIDNEADDILALCQELNEEVDRGQVPQRTVNQKLFNDHVVVPDCPPERGPEFAARISEHFVKKYRQYFDFENM